MNYRPYLLSILVIAALVAGLGYFSQPAQAAWHSLVNEDFDGDEPDWPWGNWQIIPNLSGSG